MDRQGCGGVAAEFAEAVQMTSVRASRLPHIFAIRGSVELPAGHPAHQVNKMA
jgi:hypothetical protein